MRVVVVEAHVALTDFEFALAHADSAARLDLDRAAETEALVRTAEQETLPVELELGFDQVVAEPRSAIRAQLRPRTRRSRRPDRRTRSRCACRAERGSRCPRSSLPGACTRTMRSVMSPVTRGIWRSLCCTRRPPVRDQVGVDRRLDAVAGAAAPSSRALIRARTAPSSKPRSGALPVMLRVPLPIRADAARDPELVAVDVESELEIGDWRRHAAHENLAAAQREPSAIAQPADRTGDADLPSTVPFTRSARGIIAEKAASSVGRKASDASTSASARALRRCPARRTLPCCPRGDFTAKVRPCMSSRPSRIAIGCAPGAA